MIAVETLGPVRVTVDGRPAPPALVWRKHLGLLVYLARSPRRRRTRAHLVGLLWPDKDEGAARHSLNEALRVVRKAAPDAVATDAEQVALADGAVRLDVDELERRAAGGDWAGASALVVGEFLEGFAVAGASEFEQWVSAERAEWRRRGVDALCRWAEELLGRSRLAEALEAAERARRLDPGSEAAMGWVMRALALMGHRAEALARYGEFERQVAAGIGAPVGKELAALAERVRVPPGGRAPGPVANADPLRRPPAVGRTSELGALLASWRRAAEQARGEVAIVTGAAGSGRSRLLEEIGARIALDGGVVLRIRAVAADQSEPWSGLLALAAAGLAAAPGVAGAPPQAIACLAEAVPAWSERFAVARGQGEPWSVGRAFTEAVGAAAVERPVALLIDDGHWLDDDSLAALEALARAGQDAAVWIGLTAADSQGREPLDRLASQLGRDLRGVVVSLGPLGGPEIEELVRWAFPRWQPIEVQRLARRIGTDSAGVPLFAVELIQAIASGMEPGAAAWPAPLRTLDHSLPGDLPPELVAAFRVSFRRLSDSAQAALAALAVLGDRAPAAEIARVAGLDAAGAERALDELEWTRWADCEPRGYGFVARIAREVVRQDMITPGQRQRLEAKAGGR